MIIPRYFLPGVFFICIFEKSESEKLYLWKLKEKSTGYYNQHLV